jgi:Brp/Blh family beta-carotene 15,15'-monooxygenase
LLVLLIGGVWLPPLIFFAVYFCALHSPRNFLIEWGQWEGSGTQRRILLLTYTGAAAASMAALLWLQARMALSLEAALARTLFIGLAALTVPHMALAYWVRRPAPL